MWAGFGGGGGGSGLLPGHHDLTKDLVDWKGGSIPRRVLTFLAQLGRVLSRLRPAEAYISWVGRFSLLDGIQAERGESLRGTSGEFPGSTNHGTLVTEVLQIPPYTSMCERVVKIRVRKYPVSAMQVIQDSATRTIDDAHTTSSLLSEQSSGGPMIVMSIAAARCNILSIPVHPHSKLTCEVLDSGNTTSASAKNMQAI